MSSTTESRQSTAWRNWAGNVSARPVSEVTPASVDELAAALRRASEDGHKVKAVGTGHSFTAAAATDGVLIRPDLLTGIRRIDREARTVTVEAGTPLKRLNLALAREGLSLTNMGDIMEQTVAGATSTGTHGTGRDSASISAQIRELELVTADGRVLTCSEKENADVFAAARIGIGALGVITAITFAVEPIFLLTAREEPMGFDRVTDEFEQHFTENEHFEFYWFPHTGNCNTKRNNRSAGGEAGRRGQRLLRGRGPLQRPFPGGQFTGPGRPGHHPVDRQDLQQGAVRAYVHGHPLQGLHLAAPGALRGDGVRRPARGPGPGAA